MDVSSIASWATQMTNERIAAVVQVATLKQAMDLQDRAALLHEAIPAPPANSNIDRKVNTTA